ncbi:MAG: SDR family oxidoreductase [Prevotellaceae bacterium]|jgi:NAD(P)-dependent dehydrogenase (short-subunit alcohol dehydrogenase family)|nr:SDR family oxidoreductase [Prevotellaceae bacterium]
MNSPFSLEGKNILVTGASSGIGRAVAVACAEMGANIVLTARNEQRLNETLSLMSSKNHTKIIADLTDFQQITQLVENLPKLDGFVSIAGIAKTLVANLAENQDIEEVFRANTFSAISLTQQLIQQKKLNKNASLVYISSISGVKIGYVGGGLYGASKAALEGFIKGTALELAPRGIRLNTVVPAMIETPLLAHSEISQEQLAEDAKRYPLKRYGKSEEVAYAAVYLLSDATQWITGTSLLIDGGYTLN